MHKGRVTSTKVGQICQQKNWLKMRDDILNPPDLSHIVYVARGKQDEEKGVNYLLYFLDQKNHWGGVAQYSST